MHEREGSGFRRSCPVGQRLPAAGSAGVDGRRGRDLPCDSRAADILYNIISRRHEQRSTFITTNLAYKQWGTVFPGAACVVALVDRFAQHCHRVEIVGESWRDKHRFDSDDRPPPPPGRPRRKRARA